MGAGVMITCKNRVLLLQRNKDLTWNCAGGSSERGESRYQTAIREMNEEITNVPPHLKIVNHYGTNGYTLYHGILRDIFYPMINDESIDWRWVRFSEIPKYKIHPKDRNHMQYLLRDMFE